MHILHLASRLTYGGSERVMVELATAQHADGHRVGLIAGPGPLAAQARRAGVEVMDWPLGLRSPTACAFPFRLRRLFRRLGPDVVHLHSRLPAWHAWLGLRGLGRDQRPRVISTLHGHYSAGSYSAVLLKADAVVAVSRSVADYVRQTFAGHSSVPLEIIPPGLDQGRFRRDYRVPTGWAAKHWQPHPALGRHPVICLPGRLSRLKGHRWLVWLLADLERRGQPAVGLILGGEPHGRQRYRQQIEDLARSEGLEGRLVWVPACDDVRPWMAMSSVVINVSERPEAYGRTIPESLALGVPAAGFDHGGIGELLRRMFPAGLVRPLDRADLADRIADLISQRPEIGPVDAPALDEVAQRYLDLYQRTCRSPAR